MGLDGRPNAELDVGRGGEGCLKPLLRWGMELAEGYF
jgi:hypothetical protein